MNLTHCENFNRNRRESKRELTIVEQHHVVGASGPEEVIEAATEFCEENPNGRIDYEEEEPDSTADVDVTAASVGGATTGGSKKITIICDRRPLTGPFIPNQNLPEDPNGALIGQ